MANSKEKRKLVQVSEKYSLAKKGELGELIVKYKEDYGKGLKNIEGKTHYGYNRKQKNTYRRNQSKVSLLLPQFSIAFISQQRLIFPVNFQVTRSHF